MHLVSRPAVLHVAGYRRRRHAVLRARVSLELNLAVGQAWPRGPARSGSGYQPRVHLATPFWCTPKLNQVKIAANFENS